MILAERLYTERKEETAELRKLQGLSQ